MTSYSGKINGDKVHINELRTEDIHSSGTIYWDNFDPPLSAVGVSGLAAVLDTSDDADGHDINNLGTLNALACNFPFISGITTPTASAAPVVVGSFESHG